MSTIADPVPSQPTIGLVGSQGAFGRWLRRFFETRMGLVVAGCDPAGDDSLSPAALVARSDVLVFCAPIRATVRVIDEYTALAAGAERRQLWLDLTSIKAAPVAAMLRSQAEVVGLHPMTAPPKTPTLKGRVLVVCEGRLARWRAWVEAFLAATQADIARAAPEHHDRIMALVQGMVHASHMAQGAVLNELAPALGGAAALHPFRTVGFELDGVVTRRILAGNPAIYEDIQFENPHIGSMLERLAAALDLLRDRVRDGGDAARAEVRERLLTGVRATFNAASLAEGSYGFERLGHLLADLAAPRALSVFLPLDQPGSLRALLSVFEDVGINLDSIHSSRTPDGELHFRIGVDAGCDPALLQRAAGLIAERGIGRVLG